MNWLHDNIVLHAFAGKASQRETGNFTLRLEGKKYTVVLSDGKWCGVAL